MPPQNSRPRRALGLACLLICLALPGPEARAEAPATAPDPDFLRTFAETRGFLLGRPTQIKLTPDGGAVLFLRSPARTPVLALYEYTVATGATRELVTPARLLGNGEEVLSVAEAARRERQRIVDRGFTRYDLSEDGRLVLLQLSGRIYVFDRAGPRQGRIRALTAAPPIIDPRFSPDGRKIAFVRNDDLYVVELTDTGAGPERRLTTGGSDQIMHGVAEFVAQEEMERFEGYFWSPDSRSLAYTEVDQRGLDRFTIADPAHPERAANVFPYPRPGRPNAKVRLGIIAATGGPTRWVSWDAAGFPYLARVIWKERTAPLTLVVQSRDQRALAILAVDAASGRSRALHIEKDEAWVELDHGLPRWLPGGKGLLIASERSGHRELELHDREGRFERALVPGHFGFEALLELAPDGQSAMVLTAAPTRTRVYEVPLAPAAAFRAVTPDEIAEHAAVFAHDLGAFVDTRTSVTDLPESTVYRRKSDGWEKAGVLPAVAEPPRFRANLTLGNVTAGPDSFATAVVRPRSFVAGRKYPVIVSVYGGPTVLTVRADQRAYLLAQWIADHGAVVVSIDNRGTPRRDRAWSRAIKGNFAAATLDDQANALIALIAQKPELDRDRVGIYGWSFGGYLSALAVLKRPDVYKAAVAGAPVVDWRDYDTYYTERYLDLPEKNPDGYHASSLVPLAPKLSRPLLLIHGTADDNVYFFHSLKLADALFRSGRPFEFLPLSVTHQVPDPVVREQLWGRIVDFLLRNLH